MPNKVCVPNKTEDLNLSVLNKITRISEWKTSPEHVSCECKCKCDGRKYNSNQKWNNDRCCCECKKHHICENDHIWNPATCSWKNGKYLASIFDDSVITRDEIIDAEKTKTVPQIKKFMYFTCFFISYDYYIPFTLTSD